MFGIKERIQLVALGVALVAMIEPSQGAPLQTQAATSLTTGLPAPLLDALKQRTPNTLQLPDGRRLRLESQRVVLSDPTNKAAARSFPLPALRIGASAVVLPNGHVLIWGGADTFGQLLTDGVWLDPSTGHFAVASNTGLTPIAGQSMTVLTNGVVLVAGGWNASSSDVEPLVLWHPVTGTSATLTTTLPTRLDQAATLRRDGTVALVGGVNLNGVKVDDMQRFDPATSALTDVSSTTSDGATLNVAASIPVADSTDNTADTPIGVRFSKPVDPRSVSTATVSLIGPAGPVDATIAGVQNGRMAFLTPTSDLLTGSSYTVVLAGIHSANGQKLPFTSIGFRTATVPAIGSSTPSPAASLTTGIATATRPAAASSSPAAISSAAASGGSLQAITLYRSTGIDSQGHPLASTLCSATAKGVHLCRAASYIKDGAWYPGQNNSGVSGNGHWRLNAPDEDATEIATEAVARHATERRLRNMASSAGSSNSLSGQVDQIDGHPAAHVQVTIGKQSAYTDSKGLFTLTGLAAGRQSLYVDGTTANSPGYEYGQFVVGIDVVPGEATRLPYRMYLPRILDRDKIELPSPTTQDMVVTHPDIPGLEIHIPAGTVIRDHKGKVVTELSIVPTPVDRAPFPAAQNFPVYFSIEPGGSTVQSINSKKPQGLSIVYPNYGGAPAGASADFFVYQPDEGWRVYGKGHVTADGQQIQPEAGVDLVWVMGGSFGLSNQHPGDTNPTKKCGPCEGDPVDLWSGTLTEIQTDIHINDVISIDLTRMWHDTAYLVNDIKMFGGWRSNFDIYIYSSNGDFTQPSVRLPDGNLLTFSSLPTPLHDRFKWQYTTGGPSPWNGAILEAVSYDTRCGVNEVSIECYLLTLRDGSQYQFTTSDGTASELTYIRDRFGNAVSLTWNAGLLQQVTSPSGRYISLSYNADNNIQSVADNSGRTWNYSYHSTMVTAGGSLPAYFLDTVTYPDNSVTRFTYNDNYGASSPMPGTLLSMTDRNGEVIVSNSYASGTTQVATQTLADGSTYQFSYMTNGGAPSETDVTDPLGHVRQLLFDPISGYPLSDTWGFGTSLAQKTTYARDPNGLVNSMTDALGRTTAFNYDANGNVIETTALSGTDNAVSESLAWTSDYGQIASVTDALGNTMTFTYTNGCLTNATDPLGHTTSITCNSFGQPIQVSDALGNTSSLTYQGYDLRSTTDALSRTVTYGVDTLGRITSITDPLNRTSLVTYDTNDKPVTSTDPTGLLTTVGYDHEGHVTEVTLPNGAAITTTYSARYWPSQRTDALGQSEHWTYDAMGGVATYTDRKGHATTYSPRDELNRFTQATFADGSTIAATTYDAGNRLLTLTDSIGGVMTRSYDGLDRLTGEASAQGTVGYTYYANGLRQTMTPASQAIMTYTYDGANRLIGLNQGSETVAFGYDNCDRRITMLLPNGINAAYGYDAASQLTSIMYATAKNTSVGSLAYIYDAGGQRVSQAGTLASDLEATPSTTNSTFDLNNRQIGANGHALTYDADGNLTSDGTNTYVWDSRNQLAEIQRGTTTVASFNYDAVGRRSSKTIEGISTGYLYDGANTVQESQGAVVNPILTGLGVDERFARNEGDSRSYFLVDALGSTVALANVSGTLIQQYQYDIYGNSTASATTTNPYQFTGRENDGTGLLYYRARYYSPAMARFISEDPLGFGGNQNNFYVYAGDDPLGYSDPYGLDAIAHIHRPAPGDFAPDETPCQRHAENIFMINLIPGVGTAYAVYELLNGDGSASDLTDSIGSTSELAAAAADSSSAANRSYANALQVAGMYNRRQGTLNALADADADVGSLLSTAAHALNSASFALNVYEYQKAYNECPCGH